MKEKFYIDDYVYLEAIKKGYEKYIVDAQAIQEILELFEIPIIAIDISEVINKIHDPGESSCFILLKRDGIVVTSDLRAIRRLKQNRTRAVQIVDIYFMLVENQIITAEYYDLVLEKLESVHAISPKVRFFYHQKLKETD